ncbi:unnamed protein product [Amoebophrya sp. A120]|nr:unnamed protein product [Amoebophrya sp. A120]|eukprot:GSA120T00008875001.1
MTARKVRLQRTYKSKNHQSRRQEDIICRYVLPTRFESGGVRRQNLYRPLLQMMLCWMMRPRAVGVPRMSLRCGMICVRGAWKGHEQQSCRGQTTLRVAAGVPRMLQQGSSALVRRRDSRGCAPSKVRSSFRGRNTGVILDGILALLALNTVLVGTHFDADPGESSATREGNELDHFLTNGRFLSKFRSYRRFDPNGLAQTGEPAAPKRLDHKALEVQVDVKGHAQMRREGLQRQANSKEFTLEPDPKTVAKFNLELQAEIEQNPAEFGMEKFQSFLVKRAPWFLVKKQKKGPAAADPDSLVENAKTRAEFWEHCREQKASKADKTCAITPKQVEIQMKSVGSSPTVPNGQALDIEQHIPRLVDRLSAETLEKLDAPIEPDELATAAKQLRKGGRAKDASGLTAGVLRYVDEKSLALLTDCINNEIRGKNLKELGRAVHLCRSSPLFKGRGSPEDVDNYRFIIVSPLIHKLVCKVFVTRLYEELEKQNFFPESQYGFRRGMGCHESLTVFHKLKSDFVHYQHGDGEKSTGHLMPILIDLRKAFPSIDWRCVSATMKQLGLEESALWKVMDSSHRNATYNLGGDDFTLEHGCKEGCVTSPLLFLLAYTVVMRRFLEIHEAKTAAAMVNRRPVAQRLGVNLVTKPRGIAWKREERIWDLLLNQNQPGNFTAFTSLRSLLFADDTTLLTQMATKAIGEIEKTDKENGEKKPPVPPIV